MGFFNRKTDDEKEAILKKAPYKLEKMDEDENPEDYSTLHDCENCGEQIDYDSIPFGTTLMDYVKDKTCPTCGCSTLFFK